MEIPNKKHDEKGFETPDPTPVAVPAGFRRPPTLQEQIRALVRHESYQRAVEAGEIESLEEADDFDVDDDEFPASRWEYEADEADFRAMAREEVKKAEKVKARKKAIAEKQSKSAQSKKAESKDEE